MTKADLVRIVSAETGIIRKDVALAVDAFLDSIKDSMKDGKHIEIRGFGTFKLKERKERISKRRDIREEKKGRCFYHLESFLIGVCSYKYAIGVF